PDAALWQLERSDALREDKRWGDVVAAGGAAEAGAGVAAAAAKASTCWANASSTERNTLSVQCGSSGAQINRYTISRVCGTAAMLPEPLHRGSRFAANNAHSVSA